MKKLTHFLFLFLNLLIISNNSFSQNAGVTTIGSANSCPGSIITLPLNLAGGTYIFGFSIDVYYDASVLSAIQNVNTSIFVVNPNAQLFPVTSWNYAQTDMNPGEKQIRLAWSASHAAVQLDTNALGVAHLCDLQFRYYGGSTTMNFDNSTLGGGMCEYVDSLGNPLNDMPTASYYFSGSVTQSPPPSQPSPISGSINPCEGNSTYSVINTSGVSYVWSNTGNYAGSSVVDSITYTFNTSSIPGVISVFGINTCGSSPVTSFGIVNIMIPSVAPVSVASSLDTICPQNIVTMSLSGGSLGDNAIWKWYDSSCGGALIGTGLSVNITTSLTDTYYVRAEGACNTTACAQKTVTVKTPSATPSSLTAVPASVCPGSQATIDVSGGNLGTGATWKWFTGGCGSSLLGTGISITETINIATVFYIRAEGDCNTTSCSSITILLSSFSLPATAISVTQDTICSGSFTSLTANGATPGTTANLFWYSGSCGGSFIGTGPAITISPVASNSYFAREEGQCNTTNCVSKFVTVNVPSLIGNAINANLDSVCLGSSSTLTVSGGTLGSGASWKWYTGACGGLNTGNGLTLSVNPSVTAGYYVRAEGICNTTVCLSTDIFVIPLPQAPVNISSDRNNLCSDDGGMINLSVSGGIGDVLKWYTGGCNSNAIGNGKTVQLPSPLTSTVYYANWLSLSCGNSSCVSIFLNIIQTPGPATSVNANPDTLPSGQNSTISVNGTLISGSVWRWYENSCGIGTSIGSGSSIVMSPSASTTYFVRAENGICFSSCRTIEVYIPGSLNNPGTVNAVPIQICQGQSSLLSVSDTLNGGQWYWYSGSCGGLSVGTGPSIVVYPVLTTLFYARQEAGNVSSSCGVVNVTVNNSSVHATYATAFPSVICGGAMGMLIINGGSIGTGAEWYWYLGACGGTLAGNGDTLDVYPMVTSIYFVRAEGLCNTTSCVSVSMTVLNLPIAPAYISKSADSLCSDANQNINLTAFGGSGDMINWYTGGCGMSQTGTGKILSVFSPVTTTTYFANWQTAGCGNSTCASIDINIIQSPVNPVYLTASPDSLNSGQSSTLTVTGTLQAGSSWVWYQNSCGIGSVTGTGSPFVAVPVSTTTYFVRAENGTCYSSCLSVQLFIQGSLNNPGTIVSNPPTICQGQSSTLNVSGLLNGGQWHWYTGICGGTAAGTGISLIISPSASSTYYARQESGINYSSCSAGMVNVSTLSVQPSGVTTTNNSICQGASTQLGITGGSAGTGAGWFWYSGACGGNYQGNGITLVLNPSISTGYFVRVEGTCNTTSCRSINIIVLQLPSPPLSVLSDRDSLCSDDGGNINLSVSGGSGNYVEWYTGGCGINPVGTGIILTLPSPVSTTVYYSEWHSLTCGTSICDSCTINIFPTSNDPVSVSASLDTIASGQSTTLAVNGILTSGSSWSWYENNCGTGQVIGNSQSLIVTPAGTTIFYVRAENGICHSNCLSIQIFVPGSLNYPGTVNSNPSTICEEQSSTLSVSGTLNGGNWYWYEGSCGGILIGSGAQINVIPSSSSFYYVRQESGLNYSSCSAGLVDVNSLSVQPAGINASLMTICAGSSAVLGINGGYTGSGAQWYWYSGSCGGTPEGNGISIIINPAGNTNYFVRAEGICNTTGCGSTSIVVSALSTPPASVSSNRNNLCSNDGGNIVLSLSGGSGDFAVWYTGGCEQSPSDSGRSVTVIAPVLTTTYYVNWQTYGCGNSGCISLGITVTLTPSDPQSATAYPDIITAGQSSTLSVNGTLMPGASWMWYELNCGVGANIGNGQAIVQNPSGTTTYFVRAENGTCYSNCSSVELIVPGSLNDPGVISATPSTLCQGQPTTLGVSNQLNGGQWYWYTGACGSNHVGTSASITIYPSVTTTYYARQESGSNSSSCAAAIVNINTLSVQATSITATINSICSGSSATMGVNGGIIGSGADWYWYSGSCGGIIAGNGSVDNVAPAISTTYYVRTEGICNTTVCVSKSIVVYPMTQTPASVTSDRNNLCSNDGGIINLASSGGSGDVLRWCTGGCGITQIGTGNTLSITSPLNTTTYYVRWHSANCGNSSCISIDINIVQVPSGPVSATANPDSIGTGQSTVLSVNGTLTNGASWEWYENDCGIGVNVGNGSLINIIPVATTIYYIRAENGICYSNCISVEVLISGSLNDAGTVISNPLTICQGQSSTLTLTNSTNGGQWHWYTGSCGGFPVGTGALIIESPAASTTYFVRQESGTNLSSCSAGIVNVNSLSVQPLSLAASSSAICSGYAATLSVNGGNLGSGASWHWYTVSCGGTPAGNSSTINVGPGISTTYWARAEGICNTTICLSEEITVLLLPQKPTSLTSDRNNLCSNDGGSIALSANGGNGDVIVWFAAGCGLTQLGTGNSISIISPSSSSTYYSRWNSQNCGNSTCASIFITIVQTPVSADSVSATPGTISSGQSSSLTVNGNLYAGSSWEWYENNCGIGSSVGSGTNIAVYPAGTTTYYVRAENGLCNSGCLTVQVVIPGSLNNPGIVTANPGTVCQGQNSALNLSNSLNGGQWFWYTGSCGGILYGTGLTMIVSPTTTTTYFVRQESGTNYSSCAGSIVNVNTVSVQAISAIASISTICSGSYSMLSVNGGSLGTGANWYWYSLSCGITQSGNGSSIIVYPSVTTTYYLRAEGTCNTTICVSRIITVLPLPVAPSVAVPGRNNLCSNDGGTINLSVTGGSGNSLYWYSGGCGVTQIGTGYLLTINSPVTSTTYFVRWHSANCGNSSCITLDINIINAPNTAISANANPGSISMGQSTTLSVNGSLITGASWEWYENGCGLGANVGHDSSVILTPVATTIYYVRGESALCNSGCISVEVVIPGSLNDAGTILSSPGTICQNQFSALTAANILNGGQWYWYTVSCGGMLVGTGQPMNVYPSVTTIYFVRQESGTNYSSCVAGIVNVNDVSVIPSSLTSTPSVICNGSSANLGINGGNLGTGANWYWYTGTCGGTFAGNSSTLNVNPSITENYFLRAEGMCNTTACLSIEMIVLQLPQAPASLMSSRNNLCSNDGGQVDLSSSGGNGDVLVWYLGGCGLTQYGTGNVLSVMAPSISTIYYAGWNSSSCGNSNCVSLSVNIIQLPSAADSASANPYSIGTGQSTVLTANGNIAAGAQWEWYENNCGFGTFVGSGYALTVFPAGTTVYYVRAENGTCFSNCISASVIIPGSLNNAGNILTTPAIICQGQFSTLSVSNSLNGGQWYWYTGSCGGSLIGTGLTIAVWPTIQTTYFVRQESGSNYSSCVGGIISTMNISIQAASVTASAGTICNGSFTLLGINGGLLGTGANWYWYSASCGGLSQSNGSGIIVYPTVTETYYVRAEGTCNTTGCSSIIITVMPLPQAPLAAFSDRNNLCSNDGGKINLSVSGGAGDILDWYSGGCGSTVIGTGISINISSPSNSEIYFARWHSLYCGNSSCITVDVFIVQVPNIPDSVTANPDTLSPGQNTILGSAGILTPGANWEWYENGCGIGATVGSGSSVNLTPVATTTYFVRGENGICYSNCSTIEILIPGSLNNSGALLFSPDTICQGQSSLLSPTDTLNGGQWYWYTGSCGGNLVGTGLVISINPMVTTSFFVRQESGTNYSSCTGGIIYVNALSVAASNIIASLLTVCNGSSATLGISGGFPGSGGSWYWYTGACGNNLAGNDTVITVTPSSSGNYFVRAEGMCNTTSCESINITVLPLSVAPSLVSSNRNNLCSDDGGSIVLAASGGNGDNIVWFEGGCGMTIEGTGSNITITSPTISTTYYVGWNSITCGISTCLSFDINIIQSPVPGISANANPDTITSGQSSVLTVNGSLVNGAGWIWYENNCALGVPVGSGSSINVTPVGTTTYFVRGENGVCYSSCISVEIIMPGSLNNPGTIVITPDTVCPGQTASLSVSDTTNGGQWYWYTGSCGGSLLGTGSIIIVNPSVMTIYYARQENGVYYSSCNDGIIYVNTASTPPTDLIASADTICMGSSVTLNFTGGNLGTGADWFWYSGSCGGTFIINSQTLLSVSPSATGTYYLRAEGTCNSTLCVSAEITVLTVPVLTGAISGTTSPVQNNIEVYSVNNIQDAVYSWDIPSGWTGTSMTNSITVTVGPVYPSDSIITVFASNMCGTSQVLILHLNPLEIMNGRYENNDFALSNYPNPFNDKTQIEFILPEQAKVTIEIFNILGESLKNIPGNYYSKGLHLLIFDGSGLPEGIYPYKVNILINNKLYSLTKKMNIIK